MLTDSIQSSVTAYAAALVSLFSSEPNSSSKCIDVLFGRHKCISQAYPVLVFQHFMNELIGKGGSKVADCDLSIDHVTDLLQDF